MRKKEIISLANNYVQDPDNYTESLIMVLKTLKLSELANEVKKHKYHIENSYSKLKRQNIGWRIFAKL